MRITHNNHKLQVSLAHSKHQIKAKCTVTYSFYSIFIGLFPLDTLTVSLGFSVIPNGYEA